MYIRTYIRTYVPSPGVLKATMPQCSHMARLVVGRPTQWGPGLRWSTNLRHKVRTYTPPPMYTCIISVYVRTDVCMYSTYCMYVRT